MIRRRYESFTKNSEICIDRTREGISLASVLGSVFVVRVDGSAVMDNIRFHSGMDGSV